TAIVASQFAEVVAVRQVGSREQTRETRYAGIERIASYVNELRVGQGKMNKSGKDKIRRHLVGDPFGTGRGCAYTSEIGSSQRAKLRRRDRPHHVGKHRHAVRCDKLSDGPGQVHALVGTISLRMARYYLFDQGRARSRHAEDENRHGRGLAHSLLLPQQLRRERGFDSPEALADGGFVVADLAPLEAVARDEVLKRPSRLIDIGVGLGEREMQLDQLRRWKRVLGACKRFH